MDRIGSAIRRELSRFGPVDGDMTAIVRAWPDAVGRTVARNAWPARLARDGTLHVNTAAATWAFELGRLAETILERLRETLGEGAPPALRFAPGPLPEPAGEGSEAAAAPPLDVAPRDREDAAVLAAGIADEELRELVARAAAASLARARSDHRF